MRIILGLICSWLLVAACTRDETLTRYATPGTYRLTAINGAPAPFSAMLTLGQNGEISGSAPCNSYSAQITAPYPWFELGGITATERACDQMGEEAAYFAALRAATLSEAVGPVLILSNEAGPVLEFQAD